MKTNPQLPHFSHLIQGRTLHLDWVSAISVNDYQIARPLNWHKHDDTEIIFPVRGNFHYEFDTHATTFLDNNSFLCIPSCCNHRLLEAIDTPGNRFSIHLKAPTMRTRTGAILPTEYKRIYKNILEHSLERRMLSSLQKTAAQNLWKLINRSAKNLSSDDIVRIRILTCQLLCECLTSNSQLRQISTGEIISLSKKWLEDNSSGNVNLDNLVIYIGYSRSRFFSLFKDQTGLTPGEYLRNHRIAKAKTLLSKSNMPAAAVAKTCGMGDPAYFCRTFLKMTGFSPIAYRKRHAKSSNT